MNYRKYLRIAIAVFNEHPIGFSLAAAVILINLLVGNYFVAALLGFLTAAEARVVILKAKVELLSVIAGGAVTALAFGSMFNE